MKRVLVTGGARRIGGTISRMLAEAGWHVIVHFNQSADDAEALAGSIRAAGGHCDTAQADLADRAVVAQLVPDCVRRFGTLDALVNNASFFRYDDLSSMDAPSWDAHLCPNLEAPVFLAQAFARQCAGPGCVINLLDHKVAALNPDFFSYTIAKVGLAGATRLLAQALAATAIRVNAVAPGITLISGKQTPAGFEHAWTSPPLGRSCTPDEIGSACLFMLATASLNGQIIVLDGGEGLLQHPRDIAFRANDAR